MTDATKQLSDWVLEGTSLRSSDVEITYDNGTVSYRVMVYESGRYWVGWGVDHEGNCGLSEAITRALSSMGRP